MYISIYVCGKVVQMNPICVADSERTLAGDHMIVFMINQLLIMSCARECVHYSKWEQCEMVKY
jgi:hypothetical protein